MKKEKEIAKERLVQLSMELEIAQKGRLNLQKEKKNDDIELRILKQSSQN